MHSGTNTRGGSVDGARTRQCNPINQETRILGADQSAAKVRVPVANVWRAWRGEIRPARKAFSHSSLPLHLQCVNTRHVIRDANVLHALLRLQKFILVIVHRQLVTLRLHKQRFHAVCLVLPRSDHFKRPASWALRNANGLQPERTLEAFSSAAPGGEVNRPKASQANPGLWG